MAAELIYGNWIRRRVLWALGLSAVALFLLALVPVHAILRIAGGLLALVLLVSLLFPLYAYYMFSPHGGNFQPQVYQALIAGLGERVEGLALDIGAGNGVLAVLLAKAHPAVQVIGVDYWGKNWEYAKSTCEENAKRAGVAGRVSFARGDAASLDFESESFGAVVSNLTFHEVKSEADKKALIGEALRVLRPGGVFAFVDLFYETEYYGYVSALDSYLRGLGLSKLQFEPLKERVTIPTLLQHPKILGKAGLICGRK